MITLFVIIISSVCCILIKFQYFSDSSDGDNNMDSPLIVQRKKKPAVIIDSESEEDAKSNQKDYPDELRLNDSDDDDGDAVVMSRATRLSIYGINPKGATDESDFIQSDNEESAVNIILHIFLQNMNKCTVSFYL